MALDLWNRHQADLKNYLKPTDHYARLLANRLGDSIDYCLSLNTAPVVPELHVQNGILLFELGN